MFFKEKIINPLLKLLKQGVTPEKLALSFISGMLIGCIPILGFTTIMCAGFAQAFRLNHVAIQVANYMVYPLQFILLIPYFKLGGWIFGAKPVELHVSVMIDSFKSNFMLALQEYGMIGFRGFVAWLITSPLIALVLYHPFRFAFCRVAVKIK